MFLNSYLEEFNDFVLSVGKHRKKRGLWQEIKPPTPIHGGSEEVTEGEKCYDFQSIFREQIKEKTNLFPWTTEGLRTYSFFFRFVV